MKRNKTLNVYYADVPNMGDILNKLIVEELFGYRVKHHTYLTGQLSAIGSGLGQFTYHGGIIFRIIQRISGLIFPKVSIWGTGFICYKEMDSVFFRKNTHIAAVRGQLSKQRVEKIVGKKLNIPMGDAGILSSFLLKDIPQKKYDVGIISHFKEQNEPTFKLLLENYPNSTFINVRQQPDTVIRQIAECECIISSSLHGLIIADSLHVPNIHIVVTDKLMGDGFKFNDYYSAYGLKHPYLDLNKASFPTLDWIKENYKLTPEMVRKIQVGLIDAFPFYNEDAPILNMI